MRDSPGNGNLTVASTAERDNSQLGKQLLIRPIMRIYCRLPRVL